MLKRSKGNALLITIISVVALLILAGAGYFVYKNMNKKDSRATSGNLNVSEANKSMSAELKDTCTVFSKADAASILGLSADAIKKNDTVSTTIKAGDWTQSDCTYASLDTSDAGYQAVTISVRKYTTLNGAKLNYDSAKSIAPDAQAISDMGDDAYWTAKFEQVHILKDRMNITVLAGKPKSGNSALAQKAAKLLLQKL